MGITASISTRSELLEAATYVEAQAEHEVSMMNKVRSMVKLGGAESWCRTISKSTM